MSSKLLLARLRRQREMTVELGDGLKVRCMRPPEAEMGDLLSGEGKDRVWSVGAEHVRKYVCGWDGFSEAAIFGASVGSSDPLDFDLDVWAELCADRVGWTRKVADAILKAVVDYINDREATAKNSEPA